MKCCNINSSIQFSNWLSIVKVVASTQGVYRISQRGGQGGEPTGGGQGGEPTGGGQGGEPTGGRPKGEAKLSHPLVYLVTTWRRN